MNDLNQELIPEVNIVQKSINIDSRDRNKSAYINTNDYNINLKESLFGVKKVELIFMDIILVTPKVLTLEVMILLMYPSRMLH